MELLLENKLLVERSRDPACDAARALLAKGITGKLTMQDKDGRPLCVIDIEKAAKVKAAEDGRGPRFVKFKQRGADRASSLELGPNRGAGTAKPMEEAARVDVISNSGLGFDGSFR